MNPLTNVKNIQKLSEQELKRNFKTSWHDQYKDSAWIFIGGLPYDLTEGDVICVFSQYGEVVNLNLVRDKGTGKSKGFCFLCYEDQRSTVLAVDNFNGMKILGRTIRVDHVNDYKPPKESKNTDDVTKLLFETGCAPGSKLLEVTAENKSEEKPDSKEGILKKVKKEKKKKVKKHKKAARKKSSKKKKKKNKETSSSSSSSSESSSESSDSSSSSEEEDEESDQGGHKAKQRRKDAAANRGDPKSRSAEVEERVRVKVEEEEEAKKRLRKEQRRKSPNWEEDRGDRMPGGSQRPVAKFDNGYPPARNANGDAGTGRLGRESDRMRVDREDVDASRRQDKQREEERRSRYGGPSRDERGPGRTRDNAGMDKRSYGDERDERDWSSRRDDGWVKKERYEKDSGGKWDSSSSRRKDERVTLCESGHEKGKREDKRRREERSRSPRDKDGGRGKRSH
ncbi:RNA-binding motif protein, X-linked 2-like isoform X2 [Ischnura elegans]|uniref:RNA-binding motif protein, X-linked 2-like isoform X2 n=1 Tax=Ischnura elegans TaxID=197161 RepID=UPI001ED8B671|nr:RNA-binding motif protein, X-linked 2-like isoform X2 [Ischnura elegans]